MGLSEKGPGIRQIISAWTDGPARVLGLKDRGSIAEGMRADLVIVDPALEWVYEEEEILSKSKNSPFVGWKLKGKVMATVCKGRVVFESKGRK
jgi:dihydroorotase